MAELNIDKALIDESGLVQSDEVIAMQNGCICCSLKGDLLNQVANIASQNKYDYMIVEASGISEPAEIASIFGKCEENHDHTEHAGVGQKNDMALPESATLDTCCTVVDCANFFANLTTIMSNERNNSVAQLLMEQVEFANVIILNKRDLITSSQLEKVRECVEGINPRAEIFVTTNSIIDSKHVLNTGLFDADLMKVPPMAIPEEEVPSCCAAKEAKGETACCSRKRTIKSRLSEILLAPEREKKRTRHARRFGISSFIYRARRPFHPTRLQENFLDKFFVVQGEGREGEQDASISIDGSNSEEEEEEEEALTESGDLEQDYAELKQRYIKLAQKYKRQKKLQSAQDLDEDETMNESVQAGDDDEENNINEVAGESDLESLLSSAKKKEEERTETFGELMRSKGFLWLANSHDLVCKMSQAGNMIQVTPEGLWTVLSSDAWTGSEEEKSSKQNGWKGSWGDRRQEIVLIGAGVDSLNVQEVLDDCLLNDQELELGVDGWKATMGDLVLGIH